MKKSCRRHRTAGPCAGTENLHLGGFEIFQTPSMSRKILGHASHPRWRRSAPKILHFGEGVEKIQTSSASTKNLAARWPRPPCLTHRGDVDGRSPKILDPLDQHKNPMGTPITLTMAVAAETLAPGSADPCTLGRVENFQTPSTAKKLAHAWPRPTAAMSDTLKKCRFKESQKFRPPRSA